MKKLWYLAVLLMLPLVMHGQLCKPDTSYTESGIHPDDSALPEATTGTAYEHILTIVVPEKENAQGLEVLVDSVELFKLLGFPDWLDIYCIDTCIFEGGETGCALMMGTPPDSLFDTTYQMGFITKSYARLAIAPNMPFVQNDTVSNFWNLKVNGIIGLEREAGQAELEVYATPQKVLHLRGKLPAGDANMLEIYNLAGQMVLAQPIHGRGSADRTIDLKHFRPGMYIAVVSSGNGLATGKFVVR